MQRSPEDYYGKVGEALSFADVELLVNVWADSLGFGSFGREVRALITDALPYIAKQNKIPPADSFRELVRNYDDIQAFSKKMLVSNGWLVLPRDQKVPYTLERFLELFPYTDFRGLRIIFSNKDGEILKDDYWHRGVTAFAIKRLEDGKLRVIFFSSEDYEKGEGAIPDRWYLYGLTDAEGYGDYIDTTAKTFKEDLGVSAHEGMLRRYFDPSYVPTDSGICFVSKERKNIFALMGESLEAGKKLILIENLRDDGEYRWTMRNGKRDFTYACITPLSFHFRFLTEGRQYFEGDIFEKYASYVVTNIDEAKLHNMEETVSYLAYHTDLWDHLKRSYERAARRMNVYSGFLYFAKLVGIRYACIDTGARELCLVIEQPISKMKDFTVVAHREEEGVHFYTIVLRSTLHRPGAGYVLQR